MRCWELWPDLIIQPGTGAAMWTMFFLQTLCTLARVGGINQNQSSFSWENCTLERSASERCKSLGLKWKNLVEDVFVINTDWLLRPPPWIYLKFLIWRNPGLSAGHGETVRLDHYHQHGLSLRLLECSEQWWRNSFQWNIFTEHKQTLLR